MTEFSHILDHALRDYRKKVIRNATLCDNSLQQQYFFKQIRIAEFLHDNIEILIQNISGSAGEQPEIAATHDRVQENRIGGNNAA